MRPSSHSPTKGCVPRAWDLDPVHVVSTATIEMATAPLQRPAARLTSRYTHLLPGETAAPLETDTSPDTLGPRRKAAARDPREGVSERIGGVEHDIPDR
jgi:hypothetical protein